MSPTPEAAGHLVAAAKAVHPADDGLDDAFASETGGLVFGLTVGTVTTRYTRAAALFHRTQRFTGRPASFLDWANQAGLLGVTGIRYQICHETYRDWRVRQSDAGLGRQV